MALAFDEVLVYAGAGWKGMGKGVGWIWEYVRRGCRVAGG